MSTVFRAHYPGRCANCDERIEPGDEVGYVENVVVHAGCEAATPGPEREPDICPTCHLQRPCDCT